MNNEKIYYAQLNVSKFYTVETINDLIDRLSYLGKDVYYNCDTKSIDIEVMDGVWLCDNRQIKRQLCEWIEQFPADKESIEIIKNNIDYVFNITNIAIDGVMTIKVHLF